MKRNLEEKVSGENYSDTVNTIEQKDEKIRMLLLETETMKIEHNKQMIKIQSLITEKTELYENLQKEKDSRQIVLTGAQQKYKTQLKAMRDEQNDRIKRLEALYEESQKTTGNSFDPETWIQVLEYYHYVILIINMLIKSTFWCNRTKRQTVVSTGYNFTQS